MKNKIKIFTTLPNKIKVEYIVILTFIINSINYVVYTDNTYDTNNKIRLFVAKYNPNINVVPKYFLLSIISPLIDFIIH